MAKMTMTKIKKMTMVELERAIEKASDHTTIYARGRSKQELINQFIDLYNKGLIK